MEGFCILLRRLSYPNRLVDLVKTFHRDVGTISQIITFMLKFLFDKHGHRINKLNQPYLTSLRLQELADVNVNFILPIMLI